jgi:aryl-alcohol dehydrogenase-like predicted oxidoreductase
MSSQSFHSPIHRRSFIKGVSAVTAGLVLSNPLDAAERSTPSPATGDGSIPRRTLGKTGEKVSIIGVGGHTLATAKDEATSIRIVHEAIDSGVNFMDNAACYHNGRAEEVMGKALAGGWREKVFLQTKMCTHGKTKEIGMQSLEASLRRLNTDHLDLWMIHEMNTMELVDAAFAKDGAVEALDEARRQGKVRYVGFTGHVAAEIHLAMLKHDYPFDVVLLPVNAFEAHRAGFRTQVLPEVNRRGMGALGIKSLGGNAKVVRDGKITVEQALHFALSQPITVQIVGMKSVEELRENLGIVRRFRPMPKSEQERLTAQCTDREATLYCCYRQRGYRDGDAARQACA